MKVRLTILGISGILTGLCFAQGSATPGSAKLSGTEDATLGSPKTDQITYYAALNSRLIELKTQSELLNELSLEHARRAAEISRTQEARSQWERELAKELSEKSGTCLGLLNNLYKERLAFEQAHPELSGPGSSNQVAEASSPRNADETAFLAKLEERLAMVQEEIAETAEAGRAYAAQLATNTTSADFSRITSLLQDSSNSAKQLQKEVLDLELKKLEFRALRGH